jgi:hypothetical protein
MLVVYQVVATASIGEMSQQFSVLGSRQIGNIFFLPTILYARNLPADAGIIPTDTRVLQQISQKIKGI